MTEGESSVMMVSLIIDVLDGHERDSLGEIIHLLISGFGKRNVGSVEPTEKMLIDNLPRIHQERQQEKSKKANSDYQCNNVVLCSQVLYFKKGCMHLTNLHIHCVLVFLPVFFSCLCFLGFVIWSLFDLFKISSTEFLHGINFVDINFLVDV